MEIIRIPTKYNDMVWMLDNESAWLLFKALLFWKPEWLEWYALSFYKAMKTDIDNIEFSAKNWKKWAKYWKLWWRPKTKITPEENPPPLWNETPKLNETNIKEDKIREDILNYIKENNTVTSKLLDTFIKLWYIPSKEETIDSFREFTVSVLWNKKRPDDIINDFYEYWRFEKENWKLKWKQNWKLKFKNNPLLKNYENQTA